MSALREKESEILTSLSNSPKSLSELAEELGAGFSKTTVHRIVTSLAKDGRIVASGSGRSAKYEITSVGRLFNPITPEEYFRKEQDDRQALTSFNHELFETLLNHDLFSQEEMERLTERQGEFEERRKGLSPILRRKEKERFAIDLSWKSSQIEVNLPYEFMKAASNYRNSILRRDPNLVSEADMLLLASSSTIPLIRLINATASHRYLGFSQDIMRIYVEAAAFEAVIRAMDRLSLDIKAAASASSASQTGVIAAEHLKVIEARIDEVRKDIASRSDAVFQQMGRAHSFITQIEHLERSVKGALAADLAANLSFGENL